MSADLDERAHPVVNHGDLRQPRVVPALSGLFRPFRAEDRTIMPPGRVSRRVAKVFVKPVLGHQAVLRNGVVGEQLLNLILLEHATPDSDFADAAFEETAEVPGPDAHGRGAALGDL